MSDMKTSAKKYDVSYVWETELDILDAIDRICRRNNLKYSLAYGTLLGAVRHGGFIPWDDDIDIIMPREDYNIFLNAWEKEHPDEYILQNKYTEKNFTQNFSKIRKYHSTFLHSYEEAKKGYHTGIFVDVFPGDKIPTSALARKIQFANIAINLLYARNYTSGSSGIRNLVEKLLLALPAGLKMRMYKSTDKAIQKYNKNESLPFVFANTIEWAKKEYPSDMFNYLIDIQFQGHTYRAFGEYDRILTLDYGDYMQLPPEAERVPKHHPVLIDLNKNYYELKHDGLE